MAHSVLGIMPLFGMTIPRWQDLDAMTEYLERLDWFLQHVPRSGDAKGGA